MYSQTSAALSSQPLLRYSPPTVTQPYHTPAIAYFHSRKMTCEWRNV